MGVHTDNKRIKVNKLLQGLLNFGPVPNGAIDVFFHS